MKVFKRKRDYVSETYYHWKEEIVSLQKETYKLKTQVENLIQAQKQQYIKDNPPKYDGKKVVGKYVTTVCGVMTMRPCRGVAVFDHVEELRGEFFNKYRIKTDSGLTSETTSECLLNLDNENSN